MEDGPVDPEDNEFSSLKFERNYSELQKLDERHKEFKGLVYGNQKWFIIKIFIFSINWYLFLVPLNDFFN